MKNKKITVCLENFNPNRLVFLQGPDMSGGLLKSLAEAADRAGKKGGNMPKTDPRDSRDKLTEAQVDAALNADLGAFGGTEALNKSEAPLPSSSKLGGMRNSLRNRLQGVLRKIPFVGKAIAHPRRTIQGLVHGVLNPKETAKKAFSKFRRPQSSHKTKK